MVGGPLGKIQRFATPNTTNETPWQSVSQGQAILGGAVEGYGEMLKPQLLQQIGTTLGGLNSIGALRSGQVPVALGDIATNYGNQVGAYAAQTAAEGANIGLGVQSIYQQEKQRQAQQHAALLGAIGSVLGAGIGFIAGGPPGAAIGAKAGGSISNNGGGLA